MSTANWKSYKLDELLKYEQPSSYIVHSTNYDDSFPTPVLTAGKSFIIGYTNEEDGIYSNLPVVIFDDFTTSSQYVNFPFKVKSSAMKILTPNANLVHPKFIYYRLQTINFDASTHKRYWIQTYSKIKVKIPPLEIQECIVGKIEELFSEIDNAVSSLNVVKQKLTAYRHAVYTSAFASFQDCVPLTDYFDISSGITKNPARSQLKIQMPYLRVANVYYNKLDLSEIKKIGVEKNEIAKNLLKSGDLLFVEGNGSKSQIGRVAIWDGSIPDCLHQNHIIKARVQREISVRFVLYYLMSEHGRKQILKVATSSSGLYTLSANKIRNIKIPFCPIEEQQRAVSLIEEKLSSCDMIANTICQIFQQAKALKQSVLKSAFEGTLL